MVVSRTGFSFFALVMSIRDCCEFGVGEGAICGLHATYCGSQGLVRD